MSSLFKTKDIHHPSCSTPTLHAAAERDTRVLRQYGIVPDNADTPLVLLVQLIVWGALLLAHENIWRYLTELKT